MRPAADRLADPGLGPGAVAGCEVARAALRLLQQVPELGLLAPGQVSLDPLAALVRQPQARAPAFRPGTPLPGVRGGFAREPEGHLPARLFDDFDGAVHRRVDFAVVG